MIGLTRMFLVGFALAFAGVTPAWPHDYAAGDVSVGHPYARAAHAEARSGAIYFTLRNDGAAAERLLAVRTDAAQRAELHQSVEEDGVMRMKALQDGISVPAGETVSLAPGGLHVMLFGLTRPLAAGERFQATLQFEQAGAVVVDVHVEAPPAAAPHHHH